MFTSIMVCLDMFGCTNRCKHCWIGHSPNGNLTNDDLRFVAEKFRPFTNSLTVYDWYREPDYKDGYKERWNLCQSLSNTQEQHFELISVWRIVRDKEYAKWLSSLGLKKAQLTLFGGPEKTDSYTGRKNAYSEIDVYKRQVRVHALFPQSRALLCKAAVFLEENRRKNFYAPPAWFSSFLSRYSCR